MKLLTMLMFSLLLAGCSNIQRSAEDHGWLPKSQAEHSASYSYVPLDPIPVWSISGPSCMGAAGSDLAQLEMKLAVEKDPQFRIKSVLESLPDNAVRMAIKQISGKFTSSLGASSLGVEGSRYQVVLDYINVDSTNILFYIQPGDKNVQPIVLRVPDETERNSPTQSKFLSEKERNRGKLEVNTVIPVYVGVGLRLTADIKVLRGSVNLASLAAVASSVEAGNASGSLVVQTIGLTGKQVSVSLPMPSELNQTTVQNAILALGSIKAIINDENSATVTPRVTGIYLPIKGGSDELVNKIVSELARYPIPWMRACGPSNKLAIAK